MPSHVFGDAVTVAELAYRVAEEGTTELVDDLAYERGERRLVGDAEVVAEELAEDDS